MEVMGKANVDPAELRRFAQDLNRFNNELQTLLSGLHARLRGLETTWRDQEQRKFTEAFEQTAKALSNFLEASHEHASFLSKKAGLIESYLKQR
jgi:WXG100 family type VII secretion target